MVFRRNDSKAAEKVRQRNLIFDGFLSIKPAYAVRTAPPNIDTFNDGPSPYPALVANLKVHHKRVGNQLPQQPDGCVCTIGSRPLFLTPKPHTAGEIIRILLPLVARQEPRPPIAQRNPRCAFVMANSTRHFETDRLLVRDLSIHDLDGFHQMQSDPKVLRYANGIATDRQQNELELRRCIDRYDAPENDFWIWAAVEKSNDQFAGTCALVPDHATTPPDFEIGFRFIRSKWGQGFGHELANGLIQYCIEIRNVPSLVAYVDKRNVASVKILESSRLSLTEERIDANGDPELVFRWRARL